MSLDAANPLSGGDFLVGALIGGATVLVAALFLRQDPEVRVLLWALTAKLACAVATVAIFVLHYGVNDNITYHERGVEWADAVRRAPVSEVPKHAITALTLNAAGGSTERMMSVSALLHALTADSFIGASMLLGILGLTGQVMLYRAVVSYYPARSLRRWWQAGVLFFPSVTFWSAGLFKDTLGLFGLGAAVWGLDRFARRGGARLLAAGGLSLYAMLLYRPQVLPALFCALVPWLLVGTAGGGLDIAAARGRRRRNALIIIGIVFGLLSVLVLGAGDVRLSVPRVAEGIAFELAQAERRAPVAGSNLPGPLLREITWWTVLAAWPAALTITMYRPFIWEAPGLLGLAVAVENVALVALTARAAWLVVSRRGALTRVIRAPLVVACTVFVAVSGLIIGVSQTNLGTISRYRTPLLPFAVVALVLAAHTSRLGSTSAQRDHVRLMPTGPR